MPLRLPLSLPPPRYLEFDAACLASLARASWPTSPVLPHSGVTTRASLRLAAFRPVFLLIDQLDALAGYLDLRTGRLSALLNLVRRLGKIDNVHIVLSARKFEYEHDVRLPHGTVRRPGAAPQAGSIPAPSPSAPALPPAPPTAPGDRAGVEPSRGR